MAREELQAREPRGRRAEEESKKNTVAVNGTHDPTLPCWVEGAEGHLDFPIQNLPYGVFSTPGRSPRVGVAIGDSILDLALLEEAGYLPLGNEAPFRRSSVNAFMALGREVWSETRGRLSRLLSGEDPRLKENTALRARALVERSEAKLHLPAFIRSFTDFYASRDHATNVSRMFRGPENALMPNWLHLPVGYNGRASTVVVSGSDVIRPMGQIKAPEEVAPRFAPSEKLDFELELGALIGLPSPMGKRLRTAEAHAAIFGYVLLNDWSARDIQAWEYQPLGPFQAKAFATTISPWIVTQEALEPFRVWTPEREKPLLAYLEEEAPYNFDIELTARLQPVGEAPATICRTNTRGLYYSFAQQVAHHTSSGCALCTGDLIGSGTVSGSTPESCGSLLELTWNGRNPLRIGQRQRTFLEDGDRLHLRGRCSREGAVTIGFGPCDGRILQAR